MTISSVARKATAIVVAMAAMGAVSTAYAQNSIFPTGWDNKVRDRLFMRLGYTQTFTKTKSEDARDITGLVVTRAELAQAFADGQAITVACNDDFEQSADCKQFGHDPIGGGLYGTFGPAVLYPALDAAGLGAGLGSPPGVKTKAQKSAGTPTISVGYWLDDDYKWAVEAFVLAAPLSIKIYGDGVRDDGSAMEISGKHLATTKLLPPLVVGSYNFGKRTDSIRPYVGVGAMYAIFFDARTTDYFEQYLGGKTTVTTKNTFGFGPFAGIQSAVNDNWSVNLSVGQLALKTTSTLVTTGTQIRSGSGALLDYPANVSKAISDGEQIWVDYRPDVGRTFTTNLMDLVKRRRGTADLGTFVREQKMKITNTIVTLSVGRSF